MTRVGKHNLVCLISAGWLLCGASAASGYFQDAAYGVRPAGMGEAFTAVADDANTVLFNPAGFARLSNIEFTGMYSELYLGLEARLYTGQTDQLGYNFASAAFPLSREAGTLGASWTHFYSVFYQENAFTLSYGRALVGDHVLDAGVNLKALQWLVTGNEFSTDPALFPGDREKLGVTFDAGLLCTPFPAVTFGVGADNVVPVAMGLNGVQTVPLAFRAGAAFKQQWQGSAINSLQLALEWETRDTYSTPKAGIEMWFFGRTMGVRAGGNTDELTGGLSVRYHPLGSPLDLELDYAFAYPLQVLQTFGSHRMGLTFRWRADTAAELKEQAESKTKAEAETEAETETEAPEPVIANKDQISEYYQQALKAYYLGDWETSRQWWKRLLEIDPGNLVAKKYLADIQARLNAATLPRLEHGQTRIASGAGQFAGDPLRVGLKLTHLSNLAPAQEAERLDERRAYQALAEKYGRERHLAKALEAWETVHALAPDDVQAAGQIKQVEAELRQEAEQQFALGIQAFNAKDYLTALQQFRVVQRVNPGFSQAAFYLEKTKDILANRLVKHYQTGVRYFEQKDYARALNYFELVAAISPAYHDYDRYITEAKERILTLTRFRQTVQKARNEMRESRLGHALDQLAPLMQAHTYDRSMSKVFDQIIARKGESVRDYEQGLQVYAQKDYDGAISSFNASLKLDQESPAREPLIQAYIQKGILEYRQNHLRAALSAWESVLPLQADHTLVNIYIKRVKNKIEYYQRHLGEQVLQ